MRSPVAFTQGGRDRAVPGEVPMWGTLMCAMLAVAPAARAEKPSWTEQEISALTERSISVMPWHQYVLRSMMAKDEPHAFFELAMFGAPGTFEMPSGPSIDGALMRAGAGSGFGFGKPRTGTAFFAGLQVEWGQAQQPPIFSSEGTLGMGAESILYAGIAHKGWMATYGALMNQPFVFEETADRTDGPELRMTQMVTLYNQEGVTVGGVQGRRITGELVLSALRAQLQPEQMLERLDLRRHGLFSLGVARYDQDANPYADVAEPEAPQYEIPLGGDDLGSLGVRVSVVPQILPTPKLRRAVVGYVYVSEEVTVGGQAGVVTQRDRLVPSVQTHAVFRPEWFKYFSLFGVPRIAVSYSYNVPDPIAFFPVEGAHVLGVQYIYGPAEFARPLVPIYRRDEDWGGGRY